MIRDFRQIRTVRNIITKIWNIFISLESKKILL